jgi:hypothetical protein
LADVAPRGGLRVWHRTRPAALRRGALAVGVIVLVPALLILTGFLLLLCEDTGTLPATVPVAGHDGLWVGHAWVDGRRTDRDLRALAARLRETGIRDVFAHVGPLSSDGALNPALRPRAGWLVYRAAPAGAGGAGSGLARHAHHAVLSVACPQVEPLPQLERLFLDVPHWWSAGYLHAVASRADEVALMTYGTGVPTRAAYSGLLRRQTQLALAAVPPRVTLLVGLPAFHTHEFGHSGAETVAAAVRGVRLALGTRSPRRPVGVALYVDFAATRADWAAYLTDWVVRQRALVSP